MVYLKNHPALTIGVVEILTSFFLHLQVIFLRINGPERQDRPLLLEMNRNDSEGAPLWSVLRTFEGRSCALSCQHYQKYQHRPLKRFKRPLGGKGRESQNYQWFIGGF